MCHFQIFHFPFSRLSMISGDASKQLSCPTITRSQKSRKEKKQYLETGKIASFRLLCLSFLCMSWQIWAFCTFPHIKHMGNFLSASPELNIEMKIWVIRHDHHQETIIKHHEPTAITHSFTTLTTLHNQLNMVPHLSHSPRIFFRFPWAAISGDSASPDESQTPTWSLAVAWNHHGSTIMVEAATASLINQPRKPVGIFRFPRLQGRPWAAILCALP